MDLKAMEDQRKKMQEKLQKAADDARIEREKQQKAVIRIRSRNIETARGSRAPFCFR